MSPRIKRRKVYLNHCGAGAAGYENKVRCQHCLRKMADWPNHRCVYVLVKP